MTENQQPHTIVLGNEKGGTGKSTTAMHLTVALLTEGFKVGCIDLDARQGSLSRYIENRRRLIEENDLALAVPELARVYRSEAATREKAEAEDTAALNAALADLANNDAIVIDTPGSDNFLSRLGHSHADTLITPLNDSFVDLDLLASIDPRGHKVLSPSIYSQMVWEQRQRRAIRGQRTFEWIVMRNRLSHVSARNKRDVGRLLEELARRIGFRLAPGFGERVVFRELFPKGLTLLDLQESVPGMRMQMSHVAARQEVRALLDVLGLTERVGGTDASGVFEHAESA